MIEKDFRVLVDSLIGLPYEVGGRGPSSFDCWGLVVHFYREAFDIDLPIYPNVDPMNVRRVSGHMEKAASGADWEKIMSPKNGCVVAMSRSKVFHHVGIWLDFNGGLCLHAFDGLQVMTHTLQQLKRQNFSKIAFFKHGKNYNNT